MEKNREPRNKLHMYSQLIFDKGARNNQERIVSSTNGAGKSVYIHMQKSETVPLSYAFHKAQFKTD